MGKGWQDALVTVGTAIGPELAQTAAVKGVVAGTASAVGGAVGTVATTVGGAAIALAPVVLPVAALAGAAYGAKKLFDWLNS